VVEVRERDDLEATVRGQIAQEKHERYGIGPARNTNQQTGSSRTELVALERLADSLMKL
jgi:hypothetical protein